jgi:hypothetical protein
MMHPIHVLGYITTSLDATVVHVPPQVPPKNCSTGDVDPFWPGLDTNTSFGPSSKAPYTYFFVDTNLPGVVFLKRPLLLVLPSQFLPLVSLHTVAKLIL